METQIPQKRGRSTPSKKTWLMFIYTAIIYTGYGDFERSYCSAALKAEVTISRNFDAGAVKVFVCLLS